jgi:putative glutamine amidotransferase
MGGERVQRQARPVREVPRIDYGPNAVPTVIGVSTSEMRSPQRAHPLPEGEPLTRELALGLSYPRSIDLAGAVPVVLPPVQIDHVDWLLDRLGGLMIPGGPDIHPSAYGEQPDPNLGPTEPELDAFELELIRRADARAMPILGICRGMQAINVARGGTLVQHVPDDYGERIPHRQEESGRVPTHDIEVVEGSLVASVLGAERHAVNSFHHQAVRRLGENLRPVAFAPDGVIEALEAVDRPFVVGVQWHGESLSDRADHVGLFGDFVEAAARYEIARRRAAAA